MLRADAERLARQLIGEHGLTAKGWRFDWMNGKRTCGLCCYNVKTIKLSVHYVARNDEPAIRNTILHEIAHALAGYRAAHGPEWKRVCREIGCVPSRLNHAAVMPEGKWKATCGGCQKVFSRHRYTKVPGRTYFCPRCRLPKGELKFVYRG